MGSTAETLRNLIRGLPGKQAQKAAERVVEEKQKPREKQ